MINTSFLSLFSKKTSSNFARVENRENISPIVIAFFLLIHFCRSIYCEMKKQFTIGHGFFCITNPQDVKFIFRFAEYSQKTLDF